MVPWTEPHPRGALAFLLTSALMATPAIAADQPKIDCGKGLEALFCPLKVPALIVEGRIFLAAEMMERMERVAYPMLDGINFYGQLVGEMADRVILTEGLIVDVAEDLIPGVILARTLERAVDNASGGSGDSIGGPTTDIDSLLVRQTPSRAKRPAVLDYGEAVNK